ncbi:MAG: 50S ribosomal protein L25 [Phycisphaerae bacterium]|nr:50S ribosomal protein L25 [Phycisphaerae bacterium]
MEIATIKGETRKTGGKHTNKRLRHRGQVPAVIYGHGQEPELVSLSLHDTVLAIEHTAHVISLKIESQERQYLIKDVQFDHLQKDPIHVDLMRVDPNERVQVKVPIELRGTPIGQAHGGNLVHVITELDVECLLLQIPDDIRIRIDHLGLNDALHVKEIELPSNVNILHEPDDIVAVIHPPRGATAAEIEAIHEAAEAAAEPEVIGKGPKEDAEGEGGE